MNDKKTTVDNLKVFVKDFVDERDWSQFHNPKNISMALAIEASELMDIFKWDSNDEMFKPFIELKAELNNDIKPLVENIDWLTIERLWNGCLTKFGIKLKD